MSSDGIMIDKNEIVKTGIDISEHETLQNENKESTSSSSDTNSEKTSNKGCLGFYGNDELVCKTILNQDNITVDDQVSLEGILGLVDEVENQVECLREKTKSLEEEKASLQTTLNFIAQLTSHQDDIVQPKSCISNNDISAVDKGNFCTYSIHLPVNILIIHMKKRIVSII